MKGGVILGLTLGVMATAAYYEAQNKARKAINKGKKMVKEKFEDFVEG